jgi:DNA polymerase I
MSSPVYLIDGSGYIFRAFYAVRHLSTKAGMPTNAIYGFTQMLLSFLKTCQPSQVAVVFDTKAPTFRHKRYPEYKANRSEPPEELVPQFPYFRKMTEALNIPMFEQPGYEADDLIGTLAMHMARAGHDVVIISGDKDFMQLVTDKITIWDTMKDRRIDSAAVEQRFGVPPARVIDVQGLAGDAVDNVKGVPGVGEKTAMQLIKQWGSLEDTLDHAHEIKGKLGQRLQEHRADAELAKELCTICCDVPMDLDDVSLQYVPAAPEQVRPLLMELEFTRLVQELAPVQDEAVSGEAEPETRVASTDYRCITTRDALTTLAREITRVGRCALDVETVGLDPRHAALVGIGCTTAPHAGSYIPLTHHYLGVPEQLTLATVQEVLGPVLADPAITTLFHHAKFDCPILARHGLPVLGPIDDTLLASYLLNPGGRHSLDLLAQRHLQHQNIAYADVVGKGKDPQTFADIELERATPYAAEDVDITWQLGALLLPQLAQTDVENIYRTMELPLTPILSGMEAKGVVVNAEHLAVLQQEFGRRIGTLTQAIYEAAGEEFNIASPKQLGQVLFEKLQLPGKKKTKTGFSTSADVLEALAPSHEVPRLVLQYRSLTKLRSTYVEALPKLIDLMTGRVHTQFHQTVAATGRLSSSHPNMQNIPIRTEEGRRIREAFVSPPGFQLLAADYSQIELRLLAHLSADDRLCGAFREGRDVHAETAAAIFGVAVSEVTSEQRAVGKTVNFAVIYGQTAFGMSRQLQIAPADAAEYITHYFTLYPGVVAYRDDVLRAAHRDGYVTTLYGRRRPIPEINNSRGNIAAQAEREAFNAVVQGTAADVMKIAMIALAPKLAVTGADLLLQVHDELILEVPDAEVAAVTALVHDTMAGVEPPVGQFSVPLVVDTTVGQNWAVL